MKSGTLLIFLILDVVLAGCHSTITITKASLAGKYTVRGTGWYAYETIVLHGDRFKWTYETDVLPGPEPINGKFLLEGCLLTLANPQMHVPHRIITERRGKFVMWTPEDYEAYLMTGRTPDRVLFQTR